mgnify:CR=1 FL=1
MRATGLLKVRYASKSRKETNTVYFYLSSITFYANPMQQQQTGSGEGFNPWASPTPGLSPFPAASNSVVPPSISTDSIFSSATKPNTTNPFL